MKILKSECRFICVVTALIGIVYFIYHSNYDSSLDAGNVLQAATTLFAAVIVALLLQPKMGARAKEKELLLKLYDLALKSLDELGSLKKSASVSDKAAILKVFATRCYTAENLLKSISYYTSICGDFDFRNDLAELRRLTTDSPIDQLQNNAGACKKIIKESITQLAEERDINAEAKISELTLNIIKFQIAINKR